ncbi:MAG TPA: hypothetical protein VKU39_00470 [Streptosporangiaceae bacterium]|nr:hypothetical protein [Streptosporangiaceae bacterium]
MAAAILMLNGRSTATEPVRYAIPAARTVAVSIDNQESVVAFRHPIAVLAAGTAVRTRKASTARRHTAHVAAHPAAQQVTQQPQPQPPAPRPTPSPSAPHVATGGDAAHSALGVCVRNAEEGGSYAWGPGNGGGAYQFLLSTWEAYGGAASEYGVAGPAYQDRIFDNAIAAGGASNWTAYDGC